MYSWENYCWWNSVGKSIDVASDFLILKFTCRFMKLLNQSFPVFFVSSRPKCHDRQCQKLQINREEQAATSDRHLRHNPWSRTTFLVVLEKCHDRQCQKLQISRGEQATTSDRHQRHLSLFAINLLGACSWLTFYLISFWIPFLTPIK